MTQQKSVVINGRHYDVHTGLPMQGAPSQPKQALRSANNSQSVHQSVQKSRTLRRNFVQKPTSKIQPTRTPQRAKIATSPMVAKFAPHSVSPAKKTIKSMDIAPQKHSAVQRVENKIAAQQQIIRRANTSAQAPTLRPAPAKDIKNITIAQALEKAPDHTKNTAKKQSIFARKPKLATVVTSGFALLLLGGYFTYINMPNLSVRLAASQAGIAANYPSYKPDGYSLRGPVAFEEGKVAMTFSANGGGSEFTLNQQKSAWDSDAVLNNYVKEKAGDDYYTYQDGGRTIYLFGGNAAWVNRGILYTIDGNAPISGQQISQIAASL